MSYILPSLLVLLSYLLGVYFASQGMRSAIDKPLIYNNELLLITLTILFGWIPLVSGIYSAFRNSGLIFAAILILIRFLLLPTLFNNKIKNLMDKRGF